MTMISIPVDLGERSYPIYIGEGLIKNNILFQRHLKNSTKAIVISNETIAPLYADDVISAVAQFTKVESLVLPDGEVHKNLGTVERIFDFMLSTKCDRKSTIIGVGGGVVGDICGFAAACYQRGIDYIHVPTTLLAQVDSSIGGKTGVNHPLGKNMIGAIHQPLCVITDTETLLTLPQRELRAGLAEVIKYGLIRDPKFFKTLENDIDRLLQCDSKALEFAIERSCRNKAEVVEKDERESGLRAILNFGHTFGHAIETKLRYADWLHGEAVATGMVTAGVFSQRCGYLTSDQVNRIRSILEYANLPTTPPANMTTEDFLTAMSVDKKNESGKIRLIALEDIGQAVLMQDYDPEILKGVLQEVTAS